MLVAASQYWLIRRTRIVLLSNDGQSNREVPREGVVSDHWRELIQDDQYAGRSTASGTNGAY
jgi:hypothetical protein